jgi:uncharacterized membrane protein YhaH (DUF805 family)
MRMSFGKLAIALVVAGAVLFALGGIGQDDGYWKDGPGWLGAIGWFGFLICLLLLIVTGVAALVSRLRRHDRSVPH